MEYSEKIYNEARMVAVHVHRAKGYDDIFPYEKHLDDVVRVLERFGFSGKYIVAGYLHDSIEDSFLSFNKIKERFGEDVAEMVYCVTDELGRNRKERKEKTYPKISKNKDAIVVKLADRIANIEHGGKAGMYKKEYKEFQRWLRHDDHAKEMWSHLDELMK